MRDGFAAARAGDREPRPYAWLRLLALLFACNLLALAVVARAQGAERLADAVVSVGMTVSDADRAADFYARAGADDLDGRGGASRAPPRFGRAVLVRDPDGHALRLVEP
jgi:hypothetical protein